MRFSTIPQQGGHDSRASRERVVFLGVLLLTALYGIAQLGWYWQTPFGISPVLDERENLDWALRIANGTLPPEPFFRAMGYPLLLSLFTRLPLVADKLPMAATLLGLGLHLLNTALILRITHRLSRNLGASALAGLLHGLNPVLLHFATQILDGTFANTGLLLGLTALVSIDTATPARQAAIRAGLLALAWTAAALIRPQLLVLIPLLPLSWWMARSPRPLKKLAAEWGVLFVISGALFLAQGLWQKSVSGVFGLLPAQSAYNLWAANKPGADGRFFTQTLRLTVDQAGQNPAGREAVLLYTQENGHPPVSAGALNQFWRDKLRREILRAPLDWLMLLGRKTYYLFNDFEPYNNKTYAFHKARSPWLAPNPIGWGLLLTVASVGTIALWQRNRRGALAILAPFASIAAGLLLTYVSGRFRIPLTALLCPLAGGLVFARDFSRRTRWIAAACVVLIGALTFSDFAGARDTKTFLQDTLLLAGSALDSGRDEIAWKASTQALALAPRHADAQAQLLTAGFNLLLADNFGAQREQRWQEVARELIDALPDAPQIPMVVTIAGLAQWRAGKRTAARQLWQSEAARPNGAPSAAALALANGFSAADADGQTFEKSIARTETDAASADPFSQMLRAESSAPAGNSQVLRQLAERLFPPSPSLSHP